MVIEKLNTVYIGPVAPHICTCPQWIDVDERKPTKEDSPILALGWTSDLFPTALRYDEGWAGWGWYEFNGEYGLGLLPDEAFYQKWGAIKFWMRIPAPPADRATKKAKTV